MSNTLSQPTIKTSEGYHHGRACPTNNYVARVPIHQFITNWITTMMPSGCDITAPLLRNEKWLTQNLSSLLGIRFGYAIQINTHFIKYT